MSENDNSHCAGTIKVAEKSLERTPEEKSLEATSENRHRGSGRDVLAQLGHYCQLSCPPQRSLAFSGGDIEFLRKVSPGRFRGCPPTVITDRAFPVTSSQSEYTFRCQLKAWLSRRLFRTSSDTDCILTFSLGLFSCLFQL